MGDGSPWGETTETSSPTQAPRVRASSLPMSRGGRRWSPSTIAGSSASAAISPSFMSFGRWETVPTVAGSTPCRTTPETPRGVVSITWVRTKGEAPVTAGSLRIVARAPATSVTPAGSWARTTRWALVARILSRRSSSKPVITAITVRSAATPRAIPPTENQVIRETNGSCVATGGSAGR